ncbi:putative ABC transporter ATP-binding protein YbhF [Botrimarina colliarenosi]|uniref:Putative ABC transporter ATP-binding protein YbhF n=1 Tax=Botrimarina colliarenosi TaxID=2528001 RepID=A0A5C6AC10_9BACT|nr:ABC transporter ATP-binding protein [Botrimarina colliarenosi]TWT96858.1 putative ABC transporter ATP-binding protein YbhF [Botrimarina colliarenosi]
MNAAIQIEGVTKRFGAHTAVDDVSLAVPRSSVFALLGENGAGKTTLVKMLLGLETPNAGSLSVLGLSSKTDGDAIRQRIGYVPERPTLYEWMTAAEIGWFTAGFYPDGFEQHYRNLLDFYRVPLRRKIKQMSKGMRAKVALALAMGHEPELLILDEPTSGLDTLVRREFLESMVEIASEGRTVLLCSHLIGEVERVADRVAIFREGRMLACEKLDELKRTSIEATVTMHGSGAALPHLPGRVVVSRRRGKQWQVMLRDVADPEALAALGENDAVVAVDTRTPSLEELFVAYLQSSDTESPGESAERQPLPVS